MYYHTVVLHLFRPFLKVDLTNSQVSPRDVCTSCADTVSALVSTYRNTYGFRRSSVLLGHIILSSNIIDLLNLPDCTASRNLELGVTALRESSVNHAFAIRCLHIIMALAKQWNIQLPTEVSQAAYDIPQGLPMNGFEDPYSPQTWPLTPPSASMYSQQQDDYSCRVSGAEVPDYATANGSSTLCQPADLFWSPFPDRSVPLQATQQHGPMDISAMIDVQTPHWNQLNKDGFKMVNMSNPVLGAPAHVQNGSWSYG